MQNKQAGSLFCFVLFPGDRVSSSCVIRFDSYSYVYMRNVIRIEKHRLQLPGHWGADLDTQGLVHLLSQTALLTLDFCDNYKALREMSCAVTFLPKQPGGPGKLDCHWLETNDSDPLRCNVQERYIPIMRLSL